jgi:hypothetical protein
MPQFVQMQFQMDRASEVLESTPAVLNALLRTQSAAWLNCRIGPEDFSSIDVLGHLVHGEMTDWIPRAEIILECQQSRAFEPFDRFAFGPLIAGKTAPELLDQFAELRTKSLEALRGFELGENELDLPGTHPALGAVTMRNLLATWVIHDLGHIAQIMRTMANEYREAVGPWKEYLSILK